MNTQSPRSPDEQRFVVVPAVIVVIDPITIDALAKHPRPQ